jgi:hypothetical protein
MHIRIRIDATLRHIDQDTPRSNVDCAHLRQLFLLIPTETLMPDLVVLMAKLGEVDSCTTFPLFAGIYRNLDHKQFQKCFSSKF